MYLVHIMFTSILLPRDRLTLEAVSRVRVTVVRTAAPKVILNEIHGEIWPGADGDTSDTCSFEPVVTENTVNEGSFDMCGLGLLILCHMFPESFGARIYTPEQGEWIILTSTKGRWCCWNFSRDDGLRSSHAR